MGVTDISVTMPDGRSWVPRFVQALNRDKCIGCGRCYRVCGRDVLRLVGLTDDGQTVAIAVGEDDDDDGEYEKKVADQLRAMSMVSESEIPMVRNARQFPCPTCASSTSYGWLSE